MEIIVFKSPFIAIRLVNYYRAEWWAPFEVKKLSKTLPANATSSGVLCSRGLWLIPSLHLTKSIPIGQVWLIAKASCPAPLVNARQGFVSFILIKPVSSQNCEIVLSVPVLASISSLVTCNMDSARLSKIFLSQVTAGASWVRSKLNISPLAWQTCCAYCIKCSTTAFLTLSDRDRMSTVKFVVLGITLLEPGHTRTSPTVQTNKVSSEAFKTVCLQYFSMVCIIFAEAASASFLSVIGTVPAWPCVPCTVKSSLVWPEIPTTGEANCFRCWRTGPCSMCTST